MSVQYEKRVLLEEDAISFVQNMRWFAGMGKITSEKLGKGRVCVRATKHAWSNWVQPRYAKEEECDTTSR